MNGSRNGNCGKIKRALLAALAFGLASAAPAFAGGGGESRYYVNDHLATTVGITDAAGEIATIEADAFGSPMGGGEVAGRFTGKPYDADLGAYVFPFRNYRADEARWMSADPSGFPDGENGVAYRANPLFQLDPLGLLIDVGGSNKAAYETAKQYACSSTIGQQIWSQLESSGKLYSIDTSANETAFYYESGIIAWDPTKGVQDSENGAKISPATALLHELAHAAGFDSDSSAYLNRLSQKDPTYTQAEDKRVIEIENPFAQAKGEGVRASHHGSYFTTSKLTGNQE